VSGAPRAESELARIRAEIVGRRKFLGDVRRAQQFVGEQQPDRALIVRCEDRVHSHRGSAPTLAQAAPVLGGMLVVSSIKPRASDQINLPPWDREAYLGASFEEATLGRMLHDDRLLSDWLDNLDRWERGESVREQGGHGPRWLLSEPPRTITTVLFPDRPSLITAWVRCPRQGDAECLTYRRLAEALR